MTAQLMVLLATFYFAKRYTEETLKLRLSAENQVRLLDAQIELLKEDRESQARPFFLPLNSLGENEKTLTFQNMAAPAYDIEIVGWNSAICGYPAPLFQRFAAGGDKFTIRFPQLKPVEIGTKWEFRLRYRTLTHSQFEDEFHVYGGAVVQSSLGKAIDRRVDEMMGKLN